MEGNIILGAIIVIVALLAFYVIRTYNKLVKRRNRVNTQWAHIDVQLTRRADLIPNLVETVKSYASHEKAIFEKVAAARSSLETAPSPGEAITANEHLSSHLSRLFAIAEAYPGLRADSSFISLQTELKETEDKIAYARQFYNDTVLMYQDKICQFPSSLVAKMFRFKDKSYYIAPEGKTDEARIDF